MPGDYPKCPLPSIVQVRGGISSRKRERYEFQREYARARQTDQTLFSGAIARACDQARGERKPYSRGRRRQKIL